MYKIDFFKNNKNIILSSEEKVTYLKSKLIIKKENKESIIILDFLNQKCQVNIKKDHLTIDIPVLHMNYQKSGSKDSYEYTLVSEPEVKNIIIITLK